MLIISNNRSKSFKQNHHHYHHHHHHQAVIIAPNNQPAPNTTEDDINDDIYHFKQVLYKNSNVYRLLLDDHVKESNIATSCWYNISLKLVTEMGLPVQTMHFNNMDILPITCQLLIYSSELSYYTIPNELSIEYRLNKTNDTWFTDNNTSRINLEYKITSLSNSDLPKDLFIYFQISNQMNEDILTPLGLCLGPFNINYKQQHLQQPAAWDDLYDQYKIHIHRVIPLPNDNAYSLFKELWDNGTSGKLWDSALLLNHILNILVRFDNNYLSGKRILDLSAGIGCVGLGIAKSSDLFQTINPPQIVLTDLEEAIPLMKTNQELNYLKHNSALFKRLRWGSKKDIDKVLSKGPFDYILVSDVLYNALDFSSLIDTFRQLTQNHPETTIIMGYKPRGLKQSEENSFFNTCRLYLNIKQLNLETFGKEFIKELPKQLTLYLNQTRLLEDTAVCFYKIKNINSSSSSTCLAN